jgi:AcrR family transcriptional regulator
VIAPLNLLAEPLPIEEDLDPLLDAAMAELGQYGMARTSLADVARRAGVSRPTAYRRLGNKDTMLRLLLLREIRRFFAKLDEAMSGVDSSADRATEAFVLGQLHAHHHPVLRHLMDHEPEAITPHLTTQTAFLVAARDVLAVYLGAPRTRPRRADQDAAELVVRLSISFFLTPESRLTRIDEPALRRFAARYIAPILSVR